MVQTSVPGIIKKSERRGAVVVASAILLALGAWAVSYATGAFPWIGYAWHNLASWGFGPPFSIVGNKGFRASFGLNYFPFFKGQEIVIAYDAEITAGCLLFVVFRPFVPGINGDGVFHCITVSGAGEWTMRVPETGFYAITIRPSVIRGAGRGWDMSYAVSWGARPAR